ncbi:Uncharacterised protein [Providencia rettgeri]|nr:Uncharacterised protein [Providencia rettgeri]
MENYLERLPDVIDSVATNQFYPNLLSWLSSLIAFDNAIVYSFEKGAPPRFLSKVERRNSDSINRIYQRGAYLMDPFYQEIQKGGASKVLTLKELAPKGFYHTDYYLNFYRKTGWCDEAGLLLDISTNRQLGIFLVMKIGLFSRKNIRKRHLKMPSISFVAWSNFIKMFLLLRCRITTKIQTYKHDLG